MTDSIRGSIWGLIVGDALGVPVEFCDREERREDPVTDMREYGSHRQPRGTWSDDSSMMLATLDSIADCGEINCDDIMERFASWLFDGEYTPYGETFDYGGATYTAISRYRNGAAPSDCGGRGECDNGNGSLMRILPAVLFWMTKGDASDTDPVQKVSALTHAHPVSKAGCSLYSQYIEAIAHGKDLNTVVWQEHEGINAYHRLRELRSFAALPEEEIKSGGYVVSTLEAAIWCFLNTGSYAECVLKAVNLGHDTDTTAAVAGSIAGAYYGTDGIPADWLGCIAEKDRIADMISRFEEVLNN